MAPRKVIIDTDPGLGEPGSDIDDGLAIALAVRDPRVEVLGLTIVNGNVTLETGVHVARNLADRLGVPDLPVLAGAEAPLSRDMEPVRALFEAVPGHRGRPEDQEMRAPSSSVHAADWMIEQVERFPGEITVLAIGPMTNLALAIQRSPTFAANVREFVLMAGSATGYAQNISVVGDFNTYVDPEALDEVVRSGGRLTMVGLDQTSRVLLTRADADRMLASADPFSLWAGECTHAWIDYLARAFPRRPEHADGCFLHDPLVIAAHLDPGICEWEAAHVEVEVVSDLARGLVVADRGLSLTVPGTPNATVATNTDVDAFRRLFFSRIDLSPTPDPHV
ncbi:nucleoside hydrolase [Microbacterium enclense]|uniref:Nucleoside hydrolase n=1 Tax=Microbacterium enclense TaxID=993073 RepID=A0A443JSE2_9MICO|nr:nucleoside hydrolase [Microbacterium enclense]RWR23401.1 nucleoside hydrolase [Microbacterium enclense]